MEKSFGYTIQENSHLGWIGKCCQTCSSYPLLFLTPSFMIPSAPEGKTNVLDTCNNAPW